MRLSIVLVHYHTPELLARSVEALRRDLALEGFTVPEAEWLVVDNGSDPAGRSRIEGLGVRRLDPGENLGYAGGVNLGVAASSGEHLLVLNPDVLVLQGCVGALLAELDPARGGGAAVAGPRFFWDRGERLLLPPAEPRGRRTELAALLVRRRPAAARRARARWRRHARRHWLACETLGSHALSGALLAIDRRAWEQVGPFDPGYRLYFEEADWLERARRRGLAGRYVPGARAVHLYDQSAGSEPAAPEWFLASARRFRRQRFGRAFASGLETLDRLLPEAAGDVEELPALEPGELPLAALAASPGPLWVEVSPSPTGYPAAAERLTGPSESSWRLPAEVAERFPRRRWYLTMSDAAGRELLRASLAPAQEAEGALPSPAATLPRSEVASR
ncbi:MAG TPA: glycosyltransferase [Thermoanaerobaculia bacterium]|nr:glycosyltransferase [Thermoanaerobaculia bacterium]